MLSYVVAALFVAFTAVISAQAIFNLRLRLFIWENPDRARLNRAPTTYREPSLSFTVLLPARHEEDVYRETIQKIYDLNYPKHLVQIVAICREDDPGTISEALAKIDELQDPNLELLVFNDEPINKPHGLNLGLQVARCDVVTIFDAEDEPHPEILNIINTIFLDDKVEAVQSGVQLMNHNTRWFCFLNVLEYFFWFKSAMHFFARIGMIPLGGNTVFVRRELMDKLGGWDERCLTEDADIGIRLSAGDARVRVIYDDAFVTREETPVSIGEFVRQRTRWNQGFIQILLKGDWLRLETFTQRALAFYVLVMPEAQALFVLLVPISLVTMFFVRIQIWLALFTFLPLACLALGIFIEIGGLREFKKAHHRAWSWREALVLVLSYFPYQLLLGFSAMRAVYRHIRGASNWEKTAHSGQHRAQARIGAGVYGLNEAR